MKSPPHFKTGILAAVVASSIFTASHGSAATTLLGIYESNGSIAWSGELTYSLSRDSRTIVDSGGFYGVADNAYYVSHYSPTSFDEVLEAWECFGSGNIIKFFQPAIAPPLGTTGIWDGDNGADAAWFFGGVAFSDQNHYNNPILPIAPGSFVVPYDQLNLASYLGPWIKPEFKGMTYRDPFGNAVILAPASPASGTPVPTGGSTALMLAAATLALVGIRNRMTSWGLSIPLN